MICRLIPIALLALAAAWSASAAPKVNQRSKQLSKKLAVGKMDASADPRHLAELKSRLISVLNDLEDSTRGIGPRPRDLLRQAYALRDDASTDYAQLAVSAIHDAWENARFLGLFDRDGRFDGTIRKGADEGTKAVFQYIVPVKYVPEFSRSLCNIEIVAPSKKRTSDEVSALDARVIGYGRTLRAYSKRDSLVTTKKDREAATAGQRYHLSRTKKDHDAYWAELRKADPGSADRPPSIAARIERNSTPSKATGGKYIFTITLQNRSDFPTEISFDYAFIGGSSREGYKALHRSSKKLKMLPGETHAFQEAFGGAKGSYRGYAAVVRFDGNIITPISSDARMRQFTEEGGLDRL